jgi:hypothetical protein
MGRTNLDLAWEDSPPPRQMMILLIGFSVASASAVRPKATLQNWSPLAFAGVRVALLVLLFFAFCCKSYPLLVG